MADPGFSVGGGAKPGGRQPLTRVLFGKNLCENKRIGSGWGAHASGTPWIRQWSMLFFKWTEIGNNKVLMMKMSLRSMIVNHIKISEDLFHLRVFENLVMPEMAVL